RAFAARGRRREHLAMATGIAAWKGHNVGQPTQRKSYYATSACGCGDKARIEEGARARQGAAADELEEEGVEYVTTISRLRRQSFAVIAPRAGAEVPINSGAGGMVGDASEPELFVFNYRIAVQKWALVGRAATEKAMLIDFDDRLPAIDASPGGFMDDFFKTQLVPTSIRAAKEVANLSQRKSAGLGQALAARGGRELKYLGGWFDAVGSDATELPSRLAAINKGWVMAQIFWNAAAPKRVERLMFIGLVSGAALPGTAARCWAGAEARYMCSSISRKLRSMMGGAARRQNDRVTVMTTREVYRLWGLAPFSLEATVQRLRAWQEIARDPRNRGRILGVFFEMTRGATCEHRCPPTHVDSGQFNADAVVHPWARQLRRDLEVLCGCSEAESFSLAWENRSVNDLPWDEEVNGLFVSLDAGCLRSAFAAVQWAPPDAPEASVPVAQDGENSWEDSGAQMFA
ncbi:unnamed protein product, partial [Prorocentrum cordatum]